MGISDAYVLVECDEPHCGDSEEVTLTALGTRGREWDDRYVKPHMEHRGWTMSRDGDCFCPEHKPGSDEPEPEPESESDAG